MNRKYNIKLTDKERAELERIVNTGKHSARVIKRANALLLADEGHSHATIAQYSRFTEVTMSRLAKRFIEQGLTAALYDAPRPGASPKFSAEDKARIAALAQSQAPDGRNTWTLRSLAAKVVEMELADSVAPATIRAVLKKIEPPHAEHS
jgi:transposase